jgi:AcrR family transcriptional regulator
VRGLLPPPEGGPRDRLLAGMADAVREHGFAATTVAEVVRRARTSRRTFYEHFEDRDACFLALFDVVTEQLLETIAQAATGDGRWEERVDRAMAAWLGALAADPQLTRSCIQETAGVGPEGLRRMRTVDRRWAQLLVGLVDEARAHDPELRPLTPEAATVIAGGFRELVIQTLDDGRDLLALQAVGGDLIRRITMRGSGA